MTLIARHEHQAYGGSLIRYLDACGLLNDRLGLAHSVWMLEEEIDLIRAAGTHVLLNPVGNLKPKSGVAPLRSDVDKGVDVALGCDNRSCSDVQPMFQAMTLFADLKAVSDGLADMAFGWAGYIVNRHAGNAFFGALPGGKEMLAEFRRDTLDQHAVASGILGSEVFAHAHRRIRSLADFAGRKYRSAGAFAEVIRALGATPSVIPGPDVFSLLERRAIDSAEYLTPYLNSKIGCQDVAEYVIDPGIHTPAAVYEVTMRTETWEVLRAQPSRHLRAPRHAGLSGAHAVHLRRRHRRRDRRRRGRGRRPRGR